MITYIEIDGAVLELDSSQAHIRQALTKAYERDDPVSYLRFRTDGIRVRKLGERDV